MTAPAPAGFRPFRVVAKTRESDTIASFLLEPVRPGDWRPFEPGQFLILRLPSAAAPGGFILRNYSLSCAPSVPGRYRISVKREPAAAAGLPEGLGSGHLHAQVEVGTQLLIDGPRGDFVLDRASARPAVLLSGGVGLTPMVSMLHALALQSDRSVCFIHACDNGRVHAHDQEVRGLAASRPGIRVHAVYRFPTADDVAQARHQSEGLVDRALLQQLLALDDYDFYLCGPPPFMQAVYGLLRSLGVAKPRIRYEFFGPATVLDADAPAPAVAAPAPAPVAGEGPSVTFRKSGRTARWAEGSGSLLSLAEACGLAPAFSCRAGICGSCRVGLLDGAVRYIEEPLEDPGDGQVLLCCAQPVCPVVLDL